MSWCPFCEAETVLSDSIVVDSRLLVNGWVRRRRRCRTDDAHRWSTFELRAMDLDLSERDPVDLQEVRR